MGQVLTSWGSYDSQSVPALRDTQTCAICHGTLTGNSSPSTASRLSDQADVRLCHGCFADAMSASNDSQKCSLSTCSPVEESNSMPLPPVNNGASVGQTSNNPFRIRRKAVQITPDGRATPKETCTASQPVSSDPPRRTCVSCADDLPPTDFSESQLTRSCTHDNSGCKACVQQWIETQLTDQSWDKIKCLECKEVMQYADVKRHADPEVFVRYDQLAARSVVNNEPNFVWCTNRGCTSGQVHVGGIDMPLYQCKACKYRYCIVHEEPWHEGETCNAFDRRMNGEEPEEEGEAMDERTAQLIESEGFSWGRPSVRAVKKAQSKTVTTDAQLAMDYDAALALQASFGDDVPLYYVTDRAQHRFDPLDLPDQHRVNEVASTSPIQATMKRKGFVNKWFKRKSEESPTSFPGVETSEFEASESQAANDEAIARTLHEQYIREEKERKAWLEQQAKRQQENRKAQERATREQAANDAVAAKALQQKFEQEEREREQNARALRERQQQREREREQRERQQREEAAREREAYKKRKAEEKQGEQTVRTVSKQCPNCRWSIQLSSGCDHVNTST